ncbi:MAG: HAD-IA family hydrolase [Deltaproteobacteria bacterium]|nr:HAD-IA family hydrolase [Deltaproteobacteria bacterium]MBN2672382.1 HAD-IA family hydrolase [Deltaproteobacteria bacterium]
MKIPKALIFDIDDTLVDTTPSYRGSIIRTAAHFGGTVTMEDIARAKANGDANNDWVLTQDLLSQQGIRVSIEEVTEVFEALYQGEGDTPGLKLLESLLIDIKMLGAWAKRFKMGIVTGRPRKDALDFLERYEIQHLFGAVITMDDGPLKPSPAPIRMALAALNETDAWMIGDTPDDIRSAVAAGIVALGVIAPADDPNDAVNAMQRAGAARVLKTVCELEGLLLG